MLHATPIQTLSMSPSQSWITVVLLLALVAAVIVLFRTIEQRRTELEGDATGKPERILTLVPDLPRTSTQEIYDWARHGL
ncbi:MAG: hypothetical protein ABWX92_13430 [Mycetocola sp.]